MRMLFGLVLLAGIALAGGAVYLAKDRIGEYQMANAQAQAALAQIVPTVNVFVADKPLKYGQQLKRDDVRQVAWPQNAIPEGAFIDPEILFPENNDELRVVLRAIEKDEAIMAVKVTEPGQDTGLTSRLERGTRAFTIKVDVSSGVSGFLRPGDRVDVYWTGRINIEGASQRGSGDVTKLIQAGIQLIAIDQSAGGERRGGDEGDGEESDQCAALKEMKAMTEAINPAVGDALSGILVVEAVLLAKGWGLDEWGEMYKDLPSKQVKVMVKDRAVITTTNAERIAVTPNGEFIFVCVRAIRMTDACIWCIQGCKRRSTRLLPSMGRTRGLSRGRVGRRTS